jgi:hypothetical protein
MSTPSLSILKNDLTLFNRVCGDSKSPCDTGNSCTRTQNCH